jgi:transposase-like protein
VVDVYLQARRDGAAAKRFFRRLLKSHGSEPRKIVTDKLRSYGVAVRGLMPDVIHSTEQYENNRAEQSHEATSKGARDAVVRHLGVQVDQAGTAVSRCTCSGFKSLQPG